MAGAVAMYDPAVARAEWRQNWPLVISAMLGLSMTTIVVASLGLFIEPLGREFGWSRVQVTSGLLLYALMGVLLSPLVGAAIDRWGTRPIALPGVVLAGLSIAALGFANGSVAQWLGLWLVYSVFAVGIKATLWTAAVSGVFNAGRGLALAVVLCGIAVGTASSPVIAQALIAAQGWRTAYAAMGLGWGSVVLLLALVFFFDARSRRRPSPAAAQTQAAMPVLTGLTASEALRDSSLRRIAAMVLIATLLLTALNVHFVPMLTAGGISASFAARMAMLIGIMAVCGKLGTAWAIDRLPVGLVAGIGFALPALPYAGMLIAPASVPVVILSALALGLAGGAYMHASTYLTSRFGGMRSFGKIFGVMASLIALGTGVGPVLAGAIYDATGSYRLLLISGIPLALVGGLLAASLGRFPDWNAQE
jgi:MFS family permease